MGRMLLLVAFLASFIQCHALPEDHEGRRSGNSMLTLYSHSNPHLLAPVVSNGSLPMEVVFGVNLVEVVGFDEETSQATFSLVEYQSWDEPLMVWSTDDFSFDKLHVPAQYIWRPDIKLFNSVSRDQDVYPAVNAVVENTGRVVYMPQSIRTVTCTQDPNHPDTAFCQLLFGSWTYDMSMLDIHPASERGLDLVLASMGTEWVVHRSSTHKNLQRYECCEETFPSISYDITIQRRHSVGAQQEKRSVNEELQDLE